MTLPVPAEIDARPAAHCQTGDAVNLFGIAHEARRCEGVQRLRQNLGADLAVQYDGDCGVVFVQGARRVIDYPQIQRHRADNAPCAGAGFERD